MRTWMAFIHGSLIPLHLHHLNWYGEAISPMISLQLELDCVVYWAVRVRLCCLLGTMYLWMNP